jgi:hypothetical protein
MLSVPVPFWLALHSRTWAQPSAAGQEPALNHEAAQGPPAAAADGPFIVDPLPIAQVAPALANSDVAGQQLCLIQRIAAQLAELPPGPPDNHGQLSAPETQ